MISQQVLYRRWRPKTLSELVGQEAVARTLLAALERRRVGHAYLFTGPRGTGKTSTARILAKAVNCLGNDGAGEPDATCEVCREIDSNAFVDLIEIDAASNRGIDEIRDLREKTRFAPARARMKVYVIDEVHMLTEPAFNALLKTLEEPPGQVIFILATTEPHKVPLTIASRCQRLDFRRIPARDATRRLRQVCDAEGFDVEDAALEVVVKAASGSLRDAENLLEQLVLSGGTTATAEDARGLFGVAGSARGKRIVAALLQGDATEALRAVNQFDQDGVDLRQVQREVVEELRALLLIKAGVPDLVDLPADEVQERTKLADAASLGTLRTTLEHFASLNVPSGGAPLLLEIAIVSSILAAHPDGAAPAAGIQEAQGQEPAKGQDDTPPARKQTEEQRAASAPSREAQSPKRADSGAKRQAAKQGPQAMTPPQAGPGAPPQDTDERPAILAGDIRELQRRWKEVIDSLRGFGSNRNLDAILRSSSRPLEFKGDTLVIGFYHTYHKEKVEDPKYRYLVERRIAELLGTHYKIECRLMEKPQSQGHTVQAALERGAQLEELDQEDL